MGRAFCKNIGALTLGKNLDQISQEISRTGHNFSISSDFKFFDGSVHFRIKQIVLDKIRSEFLKYGHFFDLNMMEIQQLSKT